MPVERVPTGQGAFNYGLASAREPLLAHVIDILARSERHNGSMSGTSTAHPADTLRKGAVRGRTWQFTETGDVPCAMDRGPRNSCDLAAGQLALQSSESAHKSRAVAPSVAQSRAKGVSQGRQLGRRRDGVGRTTRLHVLEGSCRLCERIDQARRLLLEQRAFPVVTSEQRAHQPV